MKYQYKCNTCETEATINKPIKDRANNEKCEVCKNNMDRIYGRDALVMAGRLIR